MIKYIACSRIFWRFTRWPPKVVECWIISLAGSWTSGPAGMLVESITLNDSLPLSQTFSSRLVLPRLTALRSNLYRFREDRQSLLLCPLPLISGNELFSPCARPKPWPSFRDLVAFASCSWLSRIRHRPALHIRYYGFEDYLLLAREDSRSDRDGYVLAWANIARVGWKKDAIYWQVEIIYHRWQEDAKDTIVKRHLATWPSYSILSRLKSGCFSLCSLNEQGFVEFERVESGEADAPPSLFITHTRWLLLTARQQKRFCTSLLRKICTYHTYVWLKFASALHAFHLDLGGWAFAWSNNRTPNMMKSTIV